MAAVRCESCFSFVLAGSDLESSKKLRDIRCEGIACYLEVVNKLVNALPLEAMEGKDRTEVVSGKWFDRTGPPVRQTRSG